MGRPSSSQETRKPEEKKCFFFNMAKYTMTKSKASSSLEKIWNYKTNQYFYQTKHFKKFKIYQMIWTEIHEEEIPKSQNRRES